MNKIATIFFSLFLLATFGFSQVNVIQNGGFETWTGSEPDNWTLKSTGITMTLENSIVHSGANSARVDFTSTSTQKIGQTVTNVTGNTNYTFEIWVLDNDPAGRFRIWGYWNLSDGSTVTLDPGNLYTTDDPDWQLYTYQETAPEGAVSLDFELRFYDVSPFPGQATIYVDDVQMLGPAVNAPVIENLTAAPFPANLPVDISCDVTVNTGTVDSVKFYYYTDLEPATLDSLEMTPGSGDQYSVNLPFMTNGTSLIYWVKAWGNGSASQSAEQRVIIGIPDIAMFHNQLDADGLPLHLNHLARLKGIATVSTGIFSTTNYDFYIQDETGGINVFAFNLGTPGFAAGDSLEVTGMIDVYNGKVEITDFSAVVLSSGNPLPLPIDVNIEDMGEEYEGRLVVIDNVSLASGSDPWITAPADTSFNITVTDGSGDLTLRVVGSTDIGGTPEPSWPITVAGIGSQFDTSSPYFTGYQILPRSAQDLGATAISHDEPLIREYRLEQNYPNPFNPETTIRYQLAAAGKVSLKVFNILGQEVYAFSGKQTAGPHEIRFDRRRLTSGIYFYRLEAGDYQAVRKMILTK